MKDKLLKQKKIYLTLLFLCIFLIFFLPCFVNKFLFLDILISLVVFVCVVLIFLFYFLIKNINNSLLIIKDEELRDSVRKYNDKKDSN